MTRVNGKFWDFFVHGTAFRDLLAPVLAEHYDDGPFPRDYPGLRHDGPHANAWRYEPGPDSTLSPLAHLRACVLSGHLASIICHLDIFNHDPDTGGVVEVDRAALTGHLLRRVDGTYDEDPTTVPWADPHLAPLMQSRNLDEFATPVPLAHVVDEVVAVVADALESGTVEVIAEEPFDSCAGCGGYHNVNYDCR